MDVHFTLGSDAFVWDAVKAQLNQRKHGVRFEEAAQVSGDPFLVLVEASRKDEARDAAIGFDASARLLFVVHVEIEDVAIRIISARLAEQKEETEYVV